MFQGDIFYKFAKHYSRELRYPIPRLALPHP